MKSILCYGDSNTYGLMPDSPDRYPRDVRWTGILQKKLGEDYYVIEEGLSGRTTLWDDPIEEHKNGKKYLLPCLDSHKPVDLVILMLGTNDLKTRFSLTPFEKCFFRMVPMLVDIKKSCFSKMYICYRWKLYQTMFLQTRVISCRCSTVFCR